MPPFTDIKKNFPILQNDPTLVYLDSAATALKPESVLVAMDQYYREYSSNVARGLYPIAEMATTAIDQVREKVATFIGGKKEGIVFTASATHSINIVAIGLRERMKKGGNIVVTALEHHSNFLPWKELAQVTEGELRIAPITKDGLIDPEMIATLIDEKTLLVALSAVSNVFGLINPVEEIVASIRKKNSQTLILIDACQAVGHVPVSRTDWGVDFLVFSGHKLFGPTGIGVLSGETRSLALLGPVNVGGGTILDPLSIPAKYKDGPERFEGGTPNIAGIIGLGAALDFIDTLGLASIQRHEQELAQYTIRRLQETFGEKIHIIGSLDRAVRLGIITFTFAHIHPHDIAHLLGEKNICIRAGEHCARPLHQMLTLPASARLSLSAYNDESDIEKLIKGLKSALQVFTP